MWMVRAGEAGFLIDRFRKENKVAIGWEIGDLSNVKSIEEIKKLVKDKYPDKNEGQVTMTASQIGKFRFELDKGDYVISYDSQLRSYLVGEIISDYLFDSNFYPEKPLEYCDTRKVKWKGEVQRDDLSTSTKNTLGAISTLFSINQEASDEILMVLKSGNGIKPPEPVDDSEILKEDIISRSHEFVKDEIMKLTWEELQELVAGLLRGMGYKTMVSSRGPDRGRDVVASPDGLGLKEPRIVVEVKHRKGKMGSSDIRSFTGGLRPGDKGLYVSTGGYTQEAKYEAERSNIPLTLMDADTIVNLIIHYYDDFDSEARTLLPLTKFYWPA